MADRIPENLPSSFVVQALFDSPTADVLLSSSDGVNFRAHRLVLSLLSPVFGDMFQLPQPRGDTLIPQIHLAESAMVLNRVLVFCYPGGQPVVDSVDHPGQSRWRHCRDAHPPLCLPVPASRSFPLP
ncbi:hypothetical protein B0H10DRAFT_1917951 [Mycena sp. CBHHK59/15]|nr:hypothetical protein B0H10DRAFT_1917951 [Mycena sp. CBHHK59/15]